MDRETRTPGTGEGAKAQPRQASRRAQRTRRELIEAAMEVLGEEGVDGTTVKAVTERAEVAHGTFYNYFDSVEAVIAAALESAVGDAAASLEAEYSDAEDKTMVVVSSVRTIFATLAEHRARDWMLDRPMAFTAALLDALLPHARRDLGAVLEQAGGDADRAQRLTPLATWLLVGGLLDVRAGTATVKGRADDVAEAVLLFMGLPENEVRKARMAR